MLIVGTGALATLFGGRLAASGVCVRMLGTWEAALHAFQERGIVIQGEEGIRHTYPVEATTDPEDCKGTMLALVLVKSWQTVRAAEQLSVCLAEKGVALTLQNGLGNLEVLEERLGAERAAIGVTTAGAHLVEPGVVESGGAGGISIGNQPRIAALVDLLCDSGFPVEVIADTLGLQWGKAIINAAINPLTALLRVKNGELVARPSLRALMSDTAHEAEAVANAVGVELPYPDPVAVVESVARKTGANTSSMLSDVLRGAPTEIDSINGAIVQAGEEAGVPAPVNRTLWQLVKGLEHPTT